jgi:xylulokinase
MCWNLEILATVGIRTERILAVGGGAKSEEWLQLKADIFNRPVVAVPGEASSRGAAICAAIGSGTYGNWDEAIASMVKPGKVFEPRPVAQRQYRELFEQYKEFAQRLYGFQFPPIGAQSEPRS